MLFIILLILKVLFCIFVILCGVWLGVYILVICIGGPLVLVANIPSFIKSIPPFIKSMTRLDWLFCVGVITCLGGWCYYCISNQGLNISYKTFNGDDPFYIYGIVVEPHTKDMRTGDIVIYVDKHVVGKINSGKISLFLASGDFVTLKKSFESDYLAKEFVTKNLAEFNKKYPLCFGQ